MRSFCKYQRDKIVGDYSFKIAIFIVFFLFLLFDYDTCIQRGSGKNQDKIFNED